MQGSYPHRCRKLVLDAGPLLSLSPLQGLAETYYTVPQVLAELKDKRAREHFERLGLVSGVKVEIKSPDVTSLAHVTQWAKKTGDYSVLSQADLCILALTYALEEEVKASGSTANEEEHPSTTPSSDLAELSLDSKRTPSPPIIPQEPQKAKVDPLVPVYDDPSDSDDGEGEWITPGNVALYKSRALELIPDAGVEKNGSKKRKSKEKVIEVGCMTADFAMQNVMLQMGLTLVGSEGNRIERVKTWVLRCHACFKVCKDPAKKFCPSCGNPSLLRASVTVSSPGASADAPAMQVHLKPNFQYKVRGTKYSIPAPKPGSAKTGTGEGLILREDQVEYMRAKKTADGKREREEAKLLKGILDRGAQGNMGAVGSWMDPDWMPEMLTIGSGGKGRSSRSAGMDGDMPRIGYGRKNPNEKRRKK